MAILLSVCGMGCEGEDAGNVVPEGGTAEALETRETIDGAARPPVPTEAVRYAREAAGTLDSRVRSVDSIVGSM